MKIGPLSIRRSARRRLVLWSCTLAVLGCRDLDPPPTLYTDLGSDEHMLLPAASAWHTLAVNNGQAEWVPFRASGSAEDSAGAAGEAARPAGAANTSATEGEIRKLIEDYNEVTAARDLEKVLEYHLPAQSDTVKALLEVALPIVDTFSELRRQLEEKLPESRERIAAAFKEHGVPSDVSFKFESLKVVSDREVIGALPAVGMTSTCRFVLVGKDWYIEFPDLPDITQLKPALEMRARDYRAWLDGLISGQIPAERVLTQLETAMKTPAVIHGFYSPQVTTPEDAEKKEAGEPALPP